MKKFLEKLLQEHETRAANLEEGIRSAETADEVRSLGEELAEVRSRTAELREQLASLENDPNVSGNAEERNKQIIGAYGFSYAQSDGGDTSDPSNSVEYRSAFRDYVVSKKPIPAELRADASTTTTDASAVIPTMLIDKIVEKLDNVGMILPLVNHTSFAAGIEIPTSSVKPVASWVSEGASSDKQKKTVSAKITFTHFKLRCEVSFSAEVGAMALAVFESKFIEQVANAMTKAIETAIVNGTGSGQPKGILAETPESGQALTVAKTANLSYKLLTEIEAAIPAEYEANAKYLMSKKTFFAFAAITDSNGQPIGRVNHGIDSRPQYILLGREVIINPYMANYADSVSANTIFAAVFDMADYTLNTIYDLGIQRRQDWDTEDNQIKAVMSIDGKVVDKGSLVTVTKLAATQSGS